MLQVRWSLNKATPSKRKTSSCEYNPVAKRLRDLAKQGKSAATNNGKGAGKGAGAAASAGAQPSAAPTSVPSLAPSTAAVVPAHTSPPAATPAAPPPPEPVAVLPAAEEVSPGAFSTFLAELDAAGIMPLNKAVSSEAVEEERLVPPASPSNSLSDDASSDVSHEAQPCDDAWSAAASTSASASCAGDEDDAARNASLESTSFDALECLLSMEPSASDAASSSPPSSNASTNGEESAEKGRAPEPEAAGVDGLHLSELWRETSASQLLHQFEDMSEIADDAQSAAVVVGADAHADGPLRGESADELDLIAQSMPSLEPAAEPLMHACDFDALCGMSSEMTEVLLHSDAAIDVPSEHDPFFMLSAEDECGSGGKSTAGQGARAKRRAPSKAAGGAKKARVRAITGGGGARKAKVGGAQKAPSASPLSSSSASSDEELVSDPRASPQPSGGAQAASATPPPAADKRRAEAGAGGGGLQWQQMKVTHNSAGMTFSWQEMSVAGRK